MSSVKFLRLSHAELARAHDRQRSAIDDWDKAHQKEAAELATLILSANVEATEIDRAQAHVAIQFNSAGLRLLAQAWDDLIDALDERRYWSELHAYTAARLLGYFQSLKRDDTPPAFAHLWADANTTVGGRSGRVTPEEGEACVQALRNLAETERTRLLAKADDLWQSRESKSRSESLTRALADPTPEGQLLQRYLNDAHRTEDQALKALARHRRDQARERREPAPYRAPRETSAEPRPSANASSSPRETNLTPQPLHPETNPPIPPKSTSETPPTPERPPSSGPAAA